MTDQLRFYTAMSVSNKERVMGDYEQGKRDCELGVPHHNKSEAYTQGYSEQYAQEQCNAAQ